MRINPRVFTFFFILVILGACNSSSENEEVKPNIVIILADDQGWGDLSFNGNPIVNTINIDQLASEGLVLDHFYVNAVCSPTRAELLTGRYHVRAGVYSTSEGGERLDLDENTIADAFQNAGYATGAFGKWHNGAQAPYHPNTRGFDEFFGFCSGHWGSYFDAMLEHNGKIVQTKGYLTDVITDKTIEFISKNSEQPFLVTLPLNTPHSPMQVPDKWMKKFKNLSIPNHRYSESENIEKTKAAYAMAENIDWNVGRIVKSLDSLGIADNTIIIYFSDNGPNGKRWNNNMKGTKGHTDEGGVRSPFVIKWGDKISGGRKVKRITHVIDLYPTLTALAGIKPTNKFPFDGTNLTDLLLGKKNQTEDRILYSYWQNQLSLRNERFRLDKENQLFDIDKDPTQADDVSLEHPEIFDEMVNAKKKWEKEVLSELPKLDNRRIPLAHPNYPITHLPARDAKVKGGIIRSNRWPNCSFYTNWNNESDTIYWKSEALSSGQFIPTLYYTCKEENIGAKINILINEELISSIKINEAFDPPLRGAEYDIIPRGESYVKDWATLQFDPIFIDKGKINLALAATNIQGNQAIDFRLLTLEKKSD